MITTEITTEQRDYIKLMNEDKHIFEMTIMRPNNVCTILIRGELGVESWTEYSHSNNTKQTTVTILRAPHYCPYKGPLLERCSCRVCVEKQLASWERDFHTGPNPTEYLSSDELPACQTREAREELFLADMLEVSCP